MMEKELIALLTTTATAVWGVYKYFDEKKKRKQEQKLKILKIEQLELENNALRIEQEGLKFNKSINEEKLSFYDDIVKLVIVNSIQDAVQNIFETTTADRILILTARNGKTDFKSADVIIDFYKNIKEKIDAVKIYTNVQLDDCYKKNLKDTEYYGFVDLETALMEVQILKHFYQTEGVKYSRILPIVRLPIDEKNDFLVYMSIAKHTENAFTDIEKTIFDLHNNNSIKPNIQKLLKNEK